MIFLSQFLYTKMSIYVQTQTRLGKGAGARGHAVSRVGLCSNGDDHLNLSREEFLSFNTGGAHPTEGWACSLIWSWFVGCLKLQLEIVGRMEEIMDLQVLHSKTFITLRSLERNSIEFKEISDSCVHRARGTGPCLLLCRRVACVSDGSCKCEPERAPPGRFCRKNDRRLPRSIRRK